MIIVIRRILLSPILISHVEGGLYYVAMRMLSSLNIRIIILRVYYLHIPVTKLITYG